MWIKGLSSNATLGEMERNAKNMEGQPGQMLRQRDLRTENNGGQKDQRIMKQTVEEKIKT